MRKMFIFFGLKNRTVCSVQIPIYRLLRNLNTTLCKQTRLFYEWGNSFPDPDKTCRLKNKRSERACIKQRVLHSGLQSTTSTISGGWFPRDHNDHGRITGRIFVAGGEVSARGPTPYTYILYLMWAERMRSNNGSERWVAPPSGQWIT